MLDTLKIKITDRMEPFLTKHKRFKVAIGGRAGTKSQTCVDILIHRVVNDGIKVCCFREFGSSIEDSVWSLISDEIHRIKVPGFDIGQRKIEHVSKGVFKSKGLGRDSKSVKSFSGFDVFLIEEGDFLTKQIIKDLTPTLRKDGAEVWVIFNPQSRGDAVSERFILPFYNELMKNKVYEDDLHYIVWTNYDENPWMPEGLEAERRLDKEILSTAEYNHKWKGHFNDYVEHQLMKAEWLEACVDAHLKIKFKNFGIRVAAHDPSDLGPDDKSYLLREGSIFLKGALKTTGDVNDGCDWALEKAIQDDADLFVWDAIGEGSALKRQVADALSPRGIDWQIYKGSDAVDNPHELFEDPTNVFVNAKKSRTIKQSIKNKRAQSYWDMRCRAFNTYLAVTKGIWSDPDRMISFSSDIEHLDQLISELSRIPRKPNSNGVIQIMEKEEMKRKYKIKSPNLADGSVICLESPEIIDDSEGLNFRKPWS